MNKIPNDDTGNAIREIISTGVDLTKRMNIDFFIEVPDKKFGEQIIRELIEKGFKTNLDYDKEYESWTCYCTKNTFLEYTNIVTIEKYLEKVASKNFGKLDGFATYGNL